MASSSRGRRSRRFFRDHRSNSGAAKNGLQFRNILGVDDRVPPLYERLREEPLSGDQLP